MKKCGYYFLLVTLFLTFKSEAFDFKTVQEKDSLYYVIAISGLNYRATPKGKVLGKFPLNTKVEIVERTGIFQEIKDEGQLKKGEWVGVKKEQTRVYVFDAFLANKKYTPPFNIYNFNSYEKKPKSIGFIVLTDSFPWSYDDDNFVDDAYLGENDIVRHKLSSTYRARFLKGLKIKETDKVFIFNYVLDTILTLKVKELSLLAEPNPYGSNKPISSSDYLIGFDLEKKLGNNKVRDYYSSFVYVGKENPFVTNNIKPIVWKETTTTTFPVFNLKEYQEYLSKDELSFLKNSKPNKVFIFENDFYTYFLGDYNQRFRCLVIQLNNKTVFSNLLYEGENGSFAPLSIAGKENEYNEQFTGKIFKNKPPVLFGFMYYSFSCSGIQFLDNKQKSIRILCDNRH